MKAKTVKEYEWQNRLKSIQNSFNMEARKLRSFAHQFEQRLTLEQRQLLIKIANSSEKISSMVREVEEEIKK